MDEQQRRMLIDWTPMLKDCLVPSSLCDYMKDFTVGTEAHDKLFNSEGATSETSIFIEILLASKTKNIYDQFVLALMKSEDQAWLAPIFDDRFGQGDIENALLHSTQMETIYKHFQKWMQLQKVNISVDVVLQNCILSKDENEEAERTCDRYGQRRAVRFIVGRLIRKGPKVLRAFHDALKSANLEFAETLLPLLEQLEKDSVDSLSTEMNKLSLDDKGKISTNEQSHSGDATTPKPLLDENAPKERSVHDDDRTFMSFPIDEEKPVGYNSDSQDQSSDNNVSSTSTSKPKDDTVVKKTEQGDDPIIDNDASKKKEKLETHEEPNELVFRDYQEELAEQAINGENSLVVAPTGTGKTFVALCVCLDHLQKKGKEAKIIFMVPKVPLIEQQHKVLSKYVKDYAVEVISGGNPEIPMVEFIQDCQIAVMTPQILVNHLVSHKNRNKKKDDLLKIQELTLLIFDECHHVSKGDPFNKIMNCYFDEKKDIEISNVKLPQILGLTASPGIGPANTHQKAEDSLKTLLGNLDVVTPPKRVVRCIENLAKNEVKENSETHAILRRTKDQFEINIKTVMDKIEKLIKDELSKAKGCKLTFNAKTRGSQVYEANVVKFYDDSAKLSNNDLKEKLMKYSMHLRGYNNSLNLNDHVRNIDAKKDIEQTLFSQVNEKNKVDFELKELYSKSINVPGPKYTNPLLSKLRSILIEEFEKKSEDSTEPSRCMIFVKTRAIANGLVSFLKDSEDLAKYELNPTRLTGANTKDVNYGKTKADQDHTIKEFKDGICKLIVATSVGEEGLDIQACNLMITYNYSTNEIGQVQRKGRARAKDSKTVMLAYKDSDIIKREKVNKLRVQLTNKTMDKLDEIYKDDQLKKTDNLKKAIEEIQKSKFDERYLERVASSRMAIDLPSASEDPWTFFCKNCSKKVTTSDMLRHINNQIHFVVEPDFNQKAHFKVDEKNAGPSAKDQRFVGKIYCGEDKCRNEWGTRIKYMKCYISVLNIKSFVLEKGKVIATAKKWKDAPFKVMKSFKVDELEEMMPRGFAVPETESN